MNSARHISVSPLTPRGEGPAVPVRTCVGCSFRDHKVAMVRLAKVEGRVVADERKVLPGRGAYVHVHCVERAFTKGGVARGLRTRVDDSCRVAVTNFVAARTELSAKDLTAG